MLDSCGIAVSVFEGTATMQLPSVRIFTLSVTVLSASLA